MSRPARLLAALLLTLVGCVGCVGCGPAMPLALDAGLDTPTDGALPDASVADAAMADAGRPPPPDAGPSLCTEGMRVELGDKQIASAAYGGGYAAFLLRHDVEPAEWEVVFVDESGAVLRHRVPAELAELLSFRYCPQPLFRLGWQGDAWTLTAGDRMARIDPVTGFLPTGTPWAPTEAGGVLSLLDAEIDEDGVGAIIFDGFWEEGEDIFCADGELFATIADEHGPGALRIPAGLRQEASAIGRRGDGYAVVHRSRSEGEEVLRVLYYDERGASLDTFAPSGNVPPMGSNLYDRWIPERIRIGGDRVVWTNRWRGTTETEQVTLHTGRLDETGIVNEREVRRELEGPDPRRTVSIFYDLAVDEGAATLGWVRESYVEILDLADGEPRHLTWLDAPPVYTYRLLATGAGGLGVGWTENRGGGDRGSVYMTLRCDR